MSSDDEDEGDEQEFSIVWDTEARGALNVRVGAIVDDMGDVTVKWIQNRSRPDVMYQLKKFPKPDRAKLIAAVRDAAGLCKHCLGAKRIQPTDAHTFEQDCPRCDGTGKEP